MELREIHNIPARVESMSVTPTSDNAASAQEADKNFETEIHEMKH